MKVSRFLTFCASATVALGIAASSAFAGEALHLVQLLSPRVAIQFLDTIDWPRYEATQINIAEEPAWEDPAIYLDLKGDTWKVIFPNNEFLSHTRRLLGDIANPRPVKGDVRKAARELLERNLVNVYRVQIGGSEHPDRAIIFTPYTIKALTIDHTIKIALDDNGLQTREGALTDGKDRDVDR